MYCLKPRENCVAWFQLSKNISPNVIFLWSRGYLGDLLWIRVIIMTIICHCTVTTQVPVNRGFGMIKCRVNHFTFSWSSVLVSQSRSREWNWYHFHLQAPWRMKCRETCYHQDLWQSSKVILVSSFFPSFFVSYFQLFIFYLALRCLNGRDNLN